MTGRLAPPPGGTTPFDHCPAAWAAFNRFYGTLWSAGRVDQPTKEVARLRNARRTGCGVCKNLRFAGARAAGLDEARVDLIADGYQASALPARWKLAIRYTDALLALPDAPIDPALRRDLLAELSPAEVVELTATITTAIAFSKAAVALGAPAEMPRLEVPTPTPDGAVAGVGR